MKVDFKLKTIVALTSLAVVLAYKAGSIQKKRRKIWSKSWFLRRYEGNNNVLAMVRNELRDEDPQSYRNYLRMSVQSFNELLNCIKSDIVKQDTVMRQSISAEDRLMVTLRYLATGETLRSLSYATRIAPNTLSGIVNKVMLALIKNLENKYLKAPETEEDWLAISEKFNTQWQFHNCIGAMDGKHVKFRPLRQDGSLYRNYKGTDSIVLFAVVDADCRFLIVDIGRNGRISDGGIFQRSPLATALENKSLNLPSPICLPERKKPIPYVILADDAFSLRENIMKPFKFHGLSNEKRIYNYRLSRARRTVENAFGIVSNRFRILLGTMNVDVSKVVTITKVCCILHNYLLTTSTSYNSETENEDLTCPLRGISRQGGNRSARNAQDIRSEFVEFFNSNGAVSWQQSAINNFKG